MATGRAGAGAGLAGEPGEGRKRGGGAGGGGVLAALGSAPPAWQGEPYSLMETGRTCNILFSRILFSVFNNICHHWLLVSSCLVSSYSSNVVTVRQRFSSNPHRFQRWHVSRKFSTETWFLCLLNSNVCCSFFIHEAVTTVVCKYSELVSI